MSLIHPYLRLILLQQSACASSAWVIGYIQHHHAPLLPANKGAICQTLNHRQEVLVAMVTRGHHGKGCPIILLKHLEDHFQLESCGGAKLQEDRAALLHNDERRK